MKSDLESIFSQLGLTPSSTLEEFQRACRRRIGNLHPDRPAVGPRSAETQTALRDLIHVHAMVNRFHRRYGRMPGAPPSHMADAAPMGATWKPSEPSAQVDTDQPGNRSRSTLVAILVALVILLATWDWLISASCGASTGCFG